MSSRPQSRLIRTPEDAEKVAEEWLRFFGFEDATVTDPGADGGVDVEGAGVVAQVKAEFKPTGRPVVQQTLGIAKHRDATAVVFSLNGYTAEASEWASEANVALFQFDLQGEPQPANSPARTLADRRSANPETEDLVALREQVVAEGQALIADILKDDLTMFGTAHEMEEDSFRRVMDSVSPTGEYETVTGLAAWRRTALLRMWLSDWRGAQISARAVFDRAKDCERIGLPFMLDSIMGYLFLLLFDPVLGALPAEVDDTELMTLFERRIDIEPGGSFELRVTLEDDDLDFLRRNMPHVVGES